MGESDVYYLAGIMIFWFCLAGVLSLFLSDDSLGQGGTNSTYYQDSLNATIDGSFNNSQLEQTGTTISLSWWNYLKIFAGMFAMRLPLINGFVNWFISGINWVLVGIFIFLIVRLIRGVG